MTTANIVYLFLLAFWGFFLEMPARIMTNAKLNIYNKHKVM